MWASRAVSGPLLTVRGLTACTRQAALPTQPKGESSRSIRRHRPRLNVQFSGARYLPRNGLLLLRVRVERPVMPHGSPASTFETSVLEAIPQTMATKATKAAGGGSSFVTASNTTTATGNVVRFC